MVRRLNIPELPSADAESPLDRSSPSLQDCKTWTKCGNTIPSNVIFRDYVEAKGKVLHVNNMFLSYLIRLFQKPTNWMYSWTIWCKMARMCEAVSLVSITCSTRVGILAQCLRAPASGFSFARWPCATRTSVLARKAGQGNMGSE